MCDDCAPQDGAPSRSKHGSSVTFPRIALQHFILSALQHLFGDAASDFALYCQGAS
jgi:hypothetical protein